jgi:hypothetical protein
MPVPPLKRLKPVHILMLRLFVEGFQYTEIADQTGYTPQQVMNVIADPLSAEILSQLELDAKDSLTEVQDRLAEVAPQILQKKIQHALHSPDASVSSRACTELLHMAGHMPVQRHIVTPADETLKKYDGLTEDELRKQYLSSIAGTGPDGRPLN